MMARSNWTFRGAFVFALMLLSSTIYGSDNPSWSASLTSKKGPGNFAPAPEMRVTYRFGWSGIPAAKASFHFFSPTQQLIETEVKASTTGLARALFKLDVYHKAMANSKTLMPINFFQEEKYRSETIKTTVDFKSDELVGTREKSPGTEPIKTNIFKFTPVFDLQTALLWIRSQPLEDGEQECLVVWASNAPYLATVRVVDREPIELNGQKRKAIKLELSLKGIDKQMGLKEHKLFKSGRGWLGDDETRIPLRIEADIFVGYVFAELESVQIQ